jgi:hypothetical protein
MPGGKAAISGAIGWPRRLPDTVGDPQSLLKWKRQGHHEPSSAELSALCQQAREALGRYLAFRASTPTPTKTQQDRLLKKARRGDLHPLKLDVNTRAIFYRGRPAPGGWRWPDPLLFTRSSNSQKSGKRLPEDHRAPETPRTANFHFLIGLLRCSRRATRKFLRSTSFATC